MICNLFFFRIPIDLLAFAITARRHHHGYSVRKSSFDMSIGSLSTAHTLEPVVRVRFQIVILMDRRYFGMARNCHQSRFRLSRVQIEDHV